MGDAEARRRLVGSGRGAPTYINLKVKSPDGHEVYFNEMRSSQLRRVMVVSCERLSLEFNDIRFVYKGHCILSEDTPDQFSGDVHTVYFRIKKTTQLNRLMTTYCDRYSVHVYCFHFLWNGRQVRPEQTPVELEMEDGELIDVMPQQPGCGNCRQLQ